jgi:hypothetical protein
LNAHIPGASRIIGIDGKTQLYLNLRYDMQARAVIPLAPAPNMIQIVSLVLVAALVAYPVVQFRAIRAARGRWRLGAALPLVPMILLWAVNIGLHQAGAEGDRAGLWELRLVFAAPTAILYLIALAFVRRSLNARHHAPSTGNAR